MKSTAYVLYNSERGMFLRKYKDNRAVLTQHLEYACPWAKEPAFSLCKALGGNWDVHELHIQCDIRPTGAVTPVLKPMSLSSDEHSVDLGNVCEKPDLN